MDFQLPELGEGVYEAELVAWKVKPGDVVKRGQILMEALTDKATMEVPAAFAGTIEHLNAKPGDQIKVGQTLLTYEPKEGAVAATRQPAAHVVAGDGAKATARRVQAAPAKGHNGAATAIKAAPSVRLMARKLGIDLTQVQGSGPEERILI